MAIHDQAQQAAQQPQPQQQAQQVQQPQQAAQQQTVAKDNRWSFHNIAMRGPLSRGMGSEYMNKLQVTLGEIYKKADTAYEITLVPVERDVYNLAFSGMVVCLRNRKSVAQKIAYHILLIEATGGPLPPEQLNFGGRQVERVLVAGDAMDIVYVEKVRECLKKTFPDAVFVDADSCVVPSDFNLDDMEAMHNLARNAGLACATVLGMSEEGFRELNLAESMHDSTLVVTQKYTNTPFVDDVGNPMRADVVIEFTSQKSKGNQTSAYNTLNTGENTEVVGVSSGFINFLWAPVEFGQNYQNQFAAYMNPFMQMPTPTQKFAAELVLTHTQCDYLSTPAAILLQLGNAMAVRDNNNWFVAFMNNRGGAKSKGSKTKHHIHDIGALGYEANIEQNKTGVGARIDTSSDSFGPEELAKLLIHAVQPGLIISYDVPECGPQTWYSSFISAAANGNVNAQADLYHAANTLTNGRFANHFPHGQDMFVNTGNRIHLGHYTDADGVKRDIRDIDYLAVANLVGDTDPKVLRDWTDTFNLTHMFPLEQRLEARLRIMKGLIPSVEVTGYATRCTFSQNFLRALEISFREAGLVVRNMQPLNRNELFNERGVARYASEALLPMGQSAFFNYGAAPAYGQMGAGYAMPTNRWM